MAWIITLVLFMTVGGWICKASDRAKYKAYQQQEIAKAELRAVKGNIYAIAWQHCLDLQLEYLKQNPVIPENESLPYHYAMEHGISLQQSSVIYALSDLRARHKSVLRVHGKDTQIVSSNEDYDPATEAEGVRGVLDPIYGPFSMPCAYKVDDEKAIAIAKPIWDREVIGTNIVKWNRQTGRIMY